MEIAGIESPSWFTNRYDNSENVRIVAKLQPSGEWWAEDPYEGTCAVAEKSPEHAILMMEGIMRRIAKEDGRRLPDYLLMVFVDESIRPYRDRVKHQLLLQFDAPADHAWDPTWKALA